MCKIPFLSIIIPCYNSEKFVRGTIESVVRQNLENVELILVNDGSADNTWGVLQEYGENYKNVICINQDNQGVSVARNTGIAAARGQYLFFLDSDDIMPEGTLVKWKIWLKDRKDIDVFAFGYISSVENKVVRDYSKKSFDKQCFDGKSILKLFLLKKIFIHNSSCLYSRDFICQKGFHYLSGVKIAEDLEWLIQVFACASKVYYSSTICWNYNLRENSAVRIKNKYSEEFFCSFLLIKKTLNEISFRHPKLNEACNFFIAISYIVNFYRYLFSKYSNKGIELKFKAEKVALYAVFPSYNRYLFLIYTMRLIPVEFVFKFRHLFLK